MGIAMKPHPRSGDPLLGMAVLLLTLIIMGCHDQAIPVAVDDEAFAATQVAGKKPNCQQDPSHPSCGDEGDGGTSCQLAFDLTLDETPGHALLSDGGGVYHDGVDQVRAFSNCGFRFDTNRQKLRRSATLDFSSPELEDLAAEVGFSVVETGIDLRFLPQGVFDFTTLGLGAQDSTLIRLHFKAADDAVKLLDYGCLIGPEWTDFILPQAVVTRIDEGTWTVEGARACLKEGWDNSVIIPDVTVPFSLTLVDQDAL